MRNIAVHCIYYISFLVFAYIILRLRYSRIMPSRQRNIHFPPSPQTH